MSQVFLYSTLTNSQSVIVYDAYPGLNANGEGKGSAKPSTRRSVINIEGGANLNATGIETPKGVLTIVSEAELKALQESACFKGWVEKGFILVESSLGDADDVADDMTDKDKSAQHTAEEHEKRFEEGETTADVALDEAPQKRAPRKTRKPAAKKTDKEKTSEE